MQGTGRFTNELRALRARSYDRCQTCGQELQHGEAAYAGYGADDLPLYVGLCCISKLYELASQVYWWWEVDKRVEPGTKLWRFMDLAKFVDLLEGRQLYFARADQLGDPFEGATGTAEREQEWERYYLEHFRRIVRQPPEGHSAPNDETVEENVAQLMRSMRMIAERERLERFVSCWHANEGESEALWRLYCPPGSAGIAIETSAARLQKALGDYSDIELGRVQYVDFRKSFAGLHDRIFWKRRSLSHEAEVRAVIMDRTMSEPHGIRQPVDIETLCVSVTPSPLAAPWFHGLVEALIRRYGLSLNVVPSELLAQPFF